MYSTKKRDERGGCTFHCVKLILYERPASSDELHRHQGNEENFSILFSGLDRIKDCARKKMTRVVIFKIERGKQKRAGGVGVAQRNTVHRSSPIDHRVCGSFLRPYHKNRGQSARLSRFKSTFIV
jgi:hypothetical protein